MLTGYTNISDYIKRFPSMICSCYCYQGYVLLCGTMDIFILHAITERVWKGLGSLEVRASA